jgi:predicted ATPase/DNA-binding NarL/FixJ family response regulator
MTSHFAAASAVEPTGNLPAEPNAFIGRERDLAELVALLGQVRALTLCGPGGIGKTRLALKLADSLAKDFPDGAWIADLAEADVPERLVPTVTAALQIRHEPDRALVDTLVAALRPRTMLLVLDTCEHQVQTAAELVQRLLAGCPGLRIIATSREALRVRGEVIWRVPPLVRPPESVTPDEAAIADSEAVRLFLARATSVRPGFALNPANVATVAEICRTLDGVPLAIELAAARVRTLSAEQIRLRLASKFELLAHGDRTAPPRQQTLRATIEWSYDLLTPAERKLLARLSVFHDWSLDMAEQVCADDELPAPLILDLLTTLIDKSLVSVEVEADGEGRYRLLETVRELAAEQADAEGERCRLGAAHRDCLLGLAEHIAGQAFLRGDPPWGQRVAMYRRVLAEQPNCRIALSYCVEHGDATAGLRLYHGLGGYWLASGAVEDGAYWADQLLALEADVPPGVRARALGTRAEIAFELQDYQGSADFAVACLTLSRSSGDGNPATGLRLQALTLLMAGRAEQALDCADQALEAARQLGDAWEEGVALAARAAVLAGQGQLADAQDDYQAALDVLDGNNRWGVANVRYRLGQLARTQGNLAEAIRHFEYALATYRQIDARPEMARCLGGIGLVALAQPDLALAKASLAQSVQLSLSTGQRLGAARGIGALAAVAVLAQDLDRAVQLAGAARELFRAIGATSSDSAVRRLDELITVAAQQLGDDAVAELAGRGAALSPQLAAQLAAGLGLSEPDSASAECSAADPAPALTEPGWPGPLTSREREIALLVAAGLSSRAISEQLVISPATVARHLANMFRKLGFSSRAQVAAWIIKSGQSGVR